MDAVLQNIKALTATQFENLTFELLRSLGLRNLVWRTPGADGGRDIEGFIELTDIAGQSTSQKWYVDSKHYSKSISWPIVHEKAAYADCHSADVLLISSTSNPSPSCESEISEWNLTHRRPQIRFWRGYDFANLVRKMPSVGVMFGLIPDPNTQQASTVPLAHIVSTIAGTAYTESEFGLPTTRTLEVAAAVSELFQKRLIDIDQFGKPVPDPNLCHKLEYDWLDVIGSTLLFEEVPLRALVTFIAYEFRATTARITECGDELKLELVAIRPECSDGLPVQRKTVEDWCRLTATLDNDGHWRIGRLPYE